jgi:hypothetical protein
MTKKIVRGLRLEPMLYAQCNAMAAARELPFCEWVRSILRREVETLTKRPKK